MVMELPQALLPVPQLLLPRLAARRFGVERVKGIEPSSLGWEPRALPLSYTRAGDRFYESPAFPGNRLGRSLCPIMTLTMCVTVDPNPHPRGPATGLPLL